MLSVGVSFGLELDQRLDLGLLILDLFLLGGYRAQNRLKLVSWQVGIGIGLHRFLLFLLLNNNNIISPLIVIHINDTNVIGVFVLLVMLTFALSMVILIVTTMLLEIVIVMVIVI